MNDYIKSNNFGFNIDISSTYYAVDSSVYFSFERIDKVDLLLSLCQNKCVLTPKIENEIFGCVSVSCLTCSYPLSYGYSSMFNKWAKIPDNSSVTYNGIDFIGEYRFNSSYQDCFYVANPYYQSVSLTSFNTANNGNVSLGELKTEADQEITKWAIQNNHNSILLSNDSEIRKIMKSLGCSIIGSVGILIKAVKKLQLSFEEAEKIYISWSNLDKGSCIWENKKLVQFRELYNLG